jgi:hypothetical protein
MRAAVYARATSGLRGYHVLSPSTHCSAMASASLSRCSIAVRSCFNVSESGFATKPRAAETTSSQATASSVVACSSVRLLRPGIAKTPLESHGSSPKIHLPAEQKQ